MLKKALVSKPRPGKLMDGSAKVGQFGIVWHRPPTINEFISDSKRQSRTSSTIQEQKVADQLSTSLDKNSPQPIKSSVFTFTNNDIKINKTIPDFRAPIVLDDYAITENDEVSQKSSQIYEAAHNFANTLQASRQTTFDSVVQNSLSAVKKPMYEAQK